MYTMIRHRVRTAGFIAAIALLTATFALLLVVASATPALAHAAYVRSIPEHDTVLKAAPTSVHITFAQALDPQGLAITVYDNKGKVVSSGTAAIDSSDPNSASIVMTGDGSDIYRVDWQTVSATDGDPTIGAFVFGVDPTGATDKVPPPATVSSGVNPLLTTGIGVVALLLGVVGTFFVMRPRGTA